MDASCGPAFPSKTTSRKLVLAPLQHEHLVDNLAVDLADISPETQNIVLGYLNKASSDLGERVAREIKHHKESH